MRKEQEDMPQEAVVNVSDGRPTLFSSSNNTERVSSKIGSFF